MKIQIDTREQLPLRFPADIQTERATLPVGDYGLARQHLRGIEKDHKRLSAHIQQKITT